MEKTAFLILIAVAILSTTVINASSTLGNLVTTAWPLINPLEEGDFPIIVGNVKDQSGKPVPGAEVKITFASQTLTSKTNNVGSFYAELSTPATPGLYEVNVISTKEGYGMSIVKTSYFVNGIPQIIPNFDPSDISKVPLLIEEGLTKNPLSQIIIQHMDKIKKQQEEQQRKQSEIENRKKFLDEQREVAETALEEELKSFEKQNEFNTPRNAFERFVYTVDETVQGIFWGQFELTETKHNEALAAKNDALKEGQTSLEATKVFQRKAAITKGEIIAHNSQLNVKYGKADTITQSYFDKDGKLRWTEESKNQNPLWYKEP